MFKGIIKNPLIKCIETAVICCVILVFFLPITLAGEKEKVYPELPLEEMRIAAYTKDFAERFGLPAPMPGTEPSGGLQAIEFAIEKGPAWTPFYYCKFYLYLDSSLPVKYPEEGIAGEKYMLIKKTHFFGSTQDQWLQWPGSDKLYFNRRQGSYNRKANLASMDYVPGKQGAIDSFSYEEFHKDILPGLAYIKLSAPTPLLISKPRKNIGVWLQKESKVDYRSRVHVDPNDFLKFAIPEHVFQKVREWGFKTKGANSEIQQSLRKQRDNQKSK